MFEARFPESEATSRKIQKRVIHIRDKLPNNNLVSELNKMPLIPSAVKEYGYYKTPLLPITFSTGVSTDVCSASSSSKTKKCEAEGVKGIRSTASQAQIERVNEKEI